MTNELGLSKTKADSKSKWVWKSVGFQIYKILVESNNIQIRIRMHHIASQDIL